MTTAQPLTISQTFSLPPSVTGVLEIDSQAIIHNYKTMTSFLGDTACVPVLKADAYGFGLQTIAPLLAHQGCNNFFVAHLEEALTLRNLLKQADIYVLSGVFRDTESLFVNQRLIPVLNDFDMLKRWVGHAQQLGTKLKCILHFDTGMHRLGFDHTDTTKLFESWSLLESLEIQMIMSHLASSPDKNDPMNHKQKLRFDALRQQLPDLPASLADTGGIYLGKDYHYDVARPGKGLFGLFKGTELKPCLTLLGQVLQVQSAAEGETVGYGGTITLTRSTRLATIGVGFADGYDRRLSNNGYALIQGYKAPILGRISMDYTVIDITDIPETLCYAGSWVELVNSQLDLDILAQSIGTISRELSTGFSSRLHRIYRS